MEPQEFDVFFHAVDPPPFPFHVPLHSASPRSMQPPHDLPVFLQRRGGSAGGNRDNVIACRVDDDALAAIDALVEAGISGTRSEAAAWLIKAGIGAQQNLLQEINGTVAEIRRLREEARAKAQGGRPSSKEERPTTGV